MKSFEKKLFEKYAYWQEQPEKIDRAEKEISILCACCGWCG